MSTIPGSTLADYYFQLRSALEIGQTLTALSLMNCLVSTIYVETAKHYPSMPINWCASCSKEIWSQPGIGLVTNRRCNLQTTLMLHKRLQHFTAAKFLVHTRVTVANYSRVHR